MRRFLVTGATGLLGGYLVHHLARQGAPFVAWRGKGGGLLSVDLADPAAVAAAFLAAAPDIVLHAAALARVGDCFHDPTRRSASTLAARALLAECCAAAGARLVLVSTDMVFDGEHAPIEKPIGRRRCRSMGGARWLRNESPLRMGATPSPG